MTITDKLFSLADFDYKSFHQKLMPTIAPERIIGVRTPILRQLAKDLFRNHPDLAQKFLARLPHFYYEENNLHAFLIECEKDFESAIILTEQFLPFIDNWATCDLFSPKVFKKYPSETYEHIKIWLKSNHEYTVRYGVGLLLSDFLDDEFKPEILKLVANIRSDKYYIQMMQAWYFATALSKQPETALTYIEQNRLSKFVHNKTIQKATESYRIDSNLKQRLRALRRR